MVLNLRHTKHVHSSHAVVLLLPLRDISYNHFIDFETFNKFAFVFDSDHFQIQAHRNVDDKEVLDMECKCSS